MTEHFQVTYTKTMNYYVSDLEEAIEVPEEVVVGGADSYDMALDIVKETLNEYPKMQLSINKIFIKD